MRNPMDDTQVMAKGGMPDRPASARRPVPAQLGRYVISEELGRGAMGVVYRARDPRINREVALKAIPLSAEFEGRDLEDARNKFFREAEMAGRLSHPHIVTIHDAGEDNGTAYIAMELLRGKHLVEYTDPARLLPSEVAIEIVACLADALHFAHRQHVVHRDIKPANVMYDAPSGELKITDFGIARLTDSTRTRTGVVLGTPSFMSPEQLQGRAVTGVRPFYAQFGFREIELALSLRPADRAGDDAVWDRAEASLAAALDRAGERYVVQPGGGAFYGPKVEIALRDRAGRAWQCGTIQLDLVMPSRFGLRYVAASGERLPFVMLHRALYGSLERFMGMLLEHHGARLPMWLAPEQVAVLPVSAREQEHAARVRDALADEGLRVCLEGGDASLSKRVAGAHERAIPWAVIIGPREVERGEVSLRSRDIRKVVSLDEARALLREEARPGA